MFETTPREIDLRAMARLLEEQFRDRPPVGAVVGKTMMRDALVTTTGCSVLDAEHVVDQLERMGYLRLTQPGSIGAVRRRHLADRRLASPPQLREAISLDRRGMPRSSGRPDRLPSWHAP